MSAKILWASQTGNCEAISQRLQSDCLAKGIKCERYCLQELGSTLKLQNKEVLIFITSSTGDGELPDNGLKFYRWIRSQSGTVLSGVRYTILGLGDSNYSTYQGGPKTVEAQLNRLGASEFYSRGEADEQMGLENVVEFWIDGLWDTLQYELEQMGNQETMEIALETEETRMIYSKIKEKRVISEKNAVKPIVELVLTIDQGYTAGADILLYPQNSRDKIERLLRYISFDPNVIINADQIPKSLTHRCKSEISMIDYFIRFVDIGSPLKSQTALYLSTLLQKSEEKEDFVSYIDLTKITMPAAYSLECILSQYTCWGISNLSEFLSRLPVLSARDYSISSTPLNSPDSIRIVFTVTGLCTRYLNSISNFDSHVIEYAIPSRKDSFWEAFEGSERILMLCNGTGISPFKGILEHLSLTKPKPVWVIYGCRNSIRGTPEHNFDHVYLEEVNEIIKRLGGRVTVANSRSPIGPKHVQDAIEEQAEEIAKWCKVAMLCGNLRSKDILRILREINPEFTLFTDLNYFKD